jgi:hypothetical protein
VYAWGPKLHPVEYVGSVVLGARAAADALWRGLQPMKCDASNPENCMLVEMMTGDVSV